MAATIAQSFENHDHKHTENNNEFGRQQIQEAIAKAVELRALHAVLIQGKSPLNLSFPSLSPVSHSASHCSAQDYPVFTPSYEDEPLQGFQQIQLQNPGLADCWEEYVTGGGHADENIQSDYKNATPLASPSVNLDPHTCPSEDSKSVNGSNHITVLKASPLTDFYKSSRRNSLGDFRSISSCNKCKPAIITSETSTPAKNSKNFNIVVPLTDSHPSGQLQPKNRGLNLLWLFTRRKKKNKNADSPNRTEWEEISQNLKHFGGMSLDTLKRELMEANERRDAALMEVTDMKSSLEELKQKLEYLETHCEELKKVSRQVAQSEKLGNVRKREKAIGGNSENLMPFSEEAMVECFLEVVSESRLSVKQLCKTLVAQIEETDTTLVDNLNLLLEPYKLSLNSKHSKAVSYHVEAMINQSLYQDFENCVFLKNGSPKLLDAEQDRRAMFSSFVALRNLSWTDVVSKGTKYYSEELSKFCDQKMSCIIATLKWTRPWPELLLQSFFASAKCIWLLHLLAFSFYPRLEILRVEENRSFDPHYMEDIFMDRQKLHGPGRVKIMVMPGFYVHDRVLRCKVLCRYKSVA